MLARTPIPEARPPSKPSSLPARRPAPSFLCLFPSLPLAFFTTLPNLGLYTACLYFPVCELSIAPLSQSNPSKSPVPFSAHVALIDHVRDLILESANALEISAASRAPSPSCLFAKMSTMASFKSDSSSIVHNSCFAMSNRSRSVLSTTKMMASVFG